ncbi:hypothetical protein K469DRAFT_605250, partial [Zopfia rhizophila CBS 207.26]
KKLIILMYIVAGQLVRELKILSIYYNNIIKSRYKNIFIKDSIIIFIIRYYKRYIVSRDIKIIYRYLLYKINKLLV